MIRVEFEFFIFTGFKPTGIHMVILGLSWCHPFPNVLCRMLDSKALSIKPANSLLHWPLRSLRHRQDYPRSPAAAHLPPTTSILRADGFSKEFDDIYTVDGYLDCDGPVAVDFVYMAEVLDYMKSHNGAPQRHSAAGKNPSSQAKKESATAFHTKPT
jgi:hypothetical protein